LDETFLANGASNVGHAGFFRVGASETVFSPQRETLSK
jgi:hypothetical protein